MTTINQVQFPKVMVVGPSGNVADVNSSGQLQTTGTAGGVTSLTGTANQIDITGSGNLTASLDSAATNALLPYAADTGSANALAITVPNIPATPTAGVGVRLKVLNSSSGATTLNVTPTGGSAWGAIAVSKRTTAGNAAIASSADLNAGGIYEFYYDGTEWIVGTTSSTTYCSGVLTASTLLRGNSNNQLQTCSGIIATAGTVFTTYNSETTAALGVTYTRASTLQKSETGAADASVVTLTPAATAAAYIISVTADVSTATSGVIGFTASYTDSNSTAVANVAIPLFQLGTAAPATTFTTSAASNYFGTLPISINNGAAAITVKWVGGGTTAAKVTAIIQRVA